MFHTILTLSYLIPNLYLFLRIWQLFIPRRFSLHYIIIYGILFAVYPLGNLIDNSDSPSHLLESISNYLLPFFLYLFLFVLLTDILLLVNLILRIIPRSKLSGYDFRIRVLFIIICLSAITVTGGIINFNTIRITEYSITVPRRASGITHLKIAFLSDFHLNEETPVRFVKKFVRKVKEADPDLLLYGGDIVEGRVQDGRLKLFADILKEVNPGYGVYGVLGNHEHYAGQDRGNFFSRSGIRLLRDTFAVAGGSIVVAGRNDSQVRSRISAGEIVAMVPDSLPVILLDHRPTEIEQISKTSADIVLSGHTHHGQMFPINLITSSVYELSYGYLKKGNIHFFVSSGIRLWGPPVRTVGKSEILVINVTLY